MNPHDYRTWTSLADHPIFSNRKEEIQQWSLKPEEYCDLEDYSTFMLDWYVHQDGLPTEVHASFAERDILMLAECCALLEQEFQGTQYELVILDDFTTYVWVNSPQFEIELYPDQLSDEGYILGLFIDVPETEDMEHHLFDVAELLSTLLGVIDQAQ